MKIVGIIQCRLSSGRLPAKAALDLHGRPLLARVVERCRMARLSAVVVATSDRPEDDVVAGIASAAGAEVHRGPLDDVRARVLGAAARFDADAFVRVTADNPYTEPRFIDALAALKETSPDCPYAVHALDEVVYGTAVELVDTAVLRANADALPSAGREHVTTGLSALPGARVLRPEAELADPRLSLTIDRIEQYRAVWALMRRFGQGPDALARIVAAHRNGDGTGFPMRD